jgi:hypothetical protein
MTMSMLNPPDGAIGNAHQADALPISGDVALIIDQHGRYQLQRLLYPRILPRLRPCWSLLRGSVCVLHSFPSV